jgi:hypothetical protein
MKKKRREKEDTTWTGCLEIHGGVEPETSNIGKERVVPSSTLDNSPPSEEFSKPPGIIGAERQKGHFNGNRSMQG